ncbi:MAG: hypothetical protein MJZ68_02530 [archaeon]|nr:hypothetical protein [archaeon]
MASDLVLFNISHYGRLAHMIAYSMTHHKDDRCILLIDTGWLSAETEEFVRSLESIPSFERFYLYDEGDIERTEGKKDMDTVTRYFDTLMEKVGVDIHDFKKVYTGFDTIHAFGLYLAAKQVRYAISDGPFSSSTDDSHVFDRSEYHALLGEKKAMTWNSPLVEKVVYTMGNSFEEIKQKMFENNHPSKGREPAQGKDIEFFPLEAAFSLMTPEDKQAVFDFFRIPEFDGSECVLLLLTSSFFLTEKYVSAHEDTMTWEEMYLLPYRLLLDRIPIGDRRLIIKAHPNTRISPVSLSVLFPGVVYIPGYVPSDILKFVDMNIGLGISPGSNSISTMSIERSYTLPRLYFGNLDMFRELPFMVDLSKKLGFDGLDLNPCMQTDLIVSLEELVGVRLSGTLSSLTVLPSLGKMRNLKGPALVRLGDLSELPDEIPEGQIFEIGWEMSEHTAVYLPGPVYYLLTGVDRDMVEYAFRSYGRYTATVLDAKCVSRHQVEWTKVRPVSSDALLRMSLEGNTVSQGKLAGELYRGENRAKDVDAALFWMENATKDDRTTKMRKTLVKMLWSEGKDLELMVSMLNVIPDEDFCSFYLGRAYRMGKGVEKDLDKALVCMRTAYRNHVKGSAKELFEILWRIETPETDNELREMVDNGLKWDEPGFLARRGKMRLYGRAVEKDLDGAVEDFVRAESLGNNTCLSDHVAALMAFGTADRDKEAFRLLDPLAEGGDAEAMAFLSKLYSEGRGVEKDESKAKELLETAAKKGVKWAKKEMSKAV